MAYNESKDVVVASKAAVSNERGRITVSFARYNGGELKCGIQRVVFSAAGDEIFAKLGRMTIPETDAVVNAIAELKRQLPVS